MLIKLTRFLIITTIATAFIVACRGEFPVNETFNESQIRKQTTPPAYEGQRKLDFAPFESTLALIASEELGAKLGTASVVDMIKMQQNGDVSSVEITAYYLSQIKAQQQLNAVLEVNPDALLIAAERDTERKEGTTLGALHGIPILLKDNVGTGDKLHTSAGAKALEQAQADRDAFIVMRLRDAGAVILGKANLSEWANFMASDSSNGFSVLGNQVHHPLGDFDVSGSSSGSAVAVAAGLAPLAIGSETSGSLVSPASQNGIVTIKPSLGFVSRDRIVPITAALDTAGPMTRNVADTALLLSVIAGPDANDAITLAAPAFELAPELASLSGLRFGMVRNAGYERGGEDVLFASVKARLEQAGAEVVSLAFPSESAENLNYLDLLFYGMQHDLREYLVATDAPVKSVAEIVAFNQQDLANRAPYGQDLLEKSAESAMSSAEYTARRDNQRDLAQTIIQTLMSENNVDVLLSFGNHFTGIYAPAGYPAVTVNAGHRPSGEPLGITFVGDLYTDATLLSIAATFESTR
ncbi:MAG: amidase family protein [Candidatus Promineifilaceae bacterium]